jgi:hypothetical protein
MYRIQLSKGLTAIISAIDYEWAMQFKWCASEQSRSGSGLYYAVRRTSRKLHPEGKQKKVWLHVEIMKRVLGVTELPAGYVPDHGQGGTLDCRRENLTLTDSHQNKINALAKTYRQWASDGNFYDIEIPDHICL